MELQKGGSVIVGISLQYLNKFSFMVIVSNFEEITPLPTNLKVSNLQSDFSVSNSVRSNFESQQNFDQYNLQN